MADQASWIIDEDGWIQDASGMPVVQYAGCGSHQAEWRSDDDKQLVINAPQLYRWLEFAVEAFTDPQSCDTDPAARRLRDEAEKLGIKWTWDDEFRTPVESK